MTHQASASPSIKRRRAEARPIRAFQWDLARQVERLDVLLALLPKYAEWGYEELYLHLEDAVEYPHFPSVARADAYRYEDLGKLVHAAGKVGLSVVPIVNLLGHTQYLIKTPELRDLNELRASDGSPLERGQVCPLHSRTLEVAAALLDDMKPFCTAGKVHVGLDESFHLGKCPRCRAEVEQHGLAYHFSHYATRLRNLAAARGLRMGLWADMLALVPEAIPQLPPDVIAYDWYYYPFRRQPRVELYNFREVDLAKALQARGIEYWGCPMNGAFRFEPLPIFGERLANLRDWWRRCEQVGADGFLVTSWEAYRLALPLTTVVDAAAVTLWDGAKPTSETGRLAQGFQRVFSLRKKAATQAATLALALDRYPFSGYASWELHTDWQVRAGITEGQGIEKSVRALRSLTQRAKRSRSTPAALRASMELRLYWEERARFVQRAATGVFEMRRFLTRRGKIEKEIRILATNPRSFNWAIGTELKTAIDLRFSRLRREATEISRALRIADRAARQMWTATRDPSRRGQNEEILMEDRRRLAEWIAWLKSARKSPGLAFGRTPVCGVYHCVFTVENFEPAAQRISLEQQQVDGSWQEIRGRHTIEFRAEAAQPKAKIRREFSAPLDDVGGALRIICRGVGRVRILKARRTNGVKTEWFQDPFVLGQRAPRSGWPDVYAVNGVRELKAR